MTDSPATVYGRRGNHALVQLEGRKYPGLLVQGDSLKQVESVVEDLMDLRPQGEGDEFDEALREVVEVIKALTDSYESMMREANLGLPY